MATARKTFRFIVSAPTGPAYIASMSPYQVRALSGSYAPTNGTSSAVSAMHSQWTALGGTGTNIMIPWSGGPKSTSGTKLWAHGGGHGDGQNNGLYSFDFAGTTRPTGWLEEYTGVPGITSDSSPGSSGPPPSIHTYDWMVDTGTHIYRMGGARYNSGGVCGAWRYTKATGAWLHLPNIPVGGAQGSAIYSASANKVLCLERESSFNGYAFYRIATNDWSAMKNVSTQWLNNPSAAYDPVGNVGLMVSNTNGGSATSFSFTVNWSAETITQSANPVASMGTGASVVWDPTRQRFWVFGGGESFGALHEINPSGWDVTAHTLTGDVASMQPQATTKGSLGRWVFMDSWRAIGTVMSRNGPACVIKLPS